MQVELLLDCRATIGESPTWSAAEQALYWIDVKEPALHRLDADGGRRRWGFDADIGAFALTDGPPGAIVALRTGLFECNLGTGATRLLAPAPFDGDLFRFNEGICDARGRFWVGVMFDPLPGHAAAPRAGALHCFTRDGGLRPAADWAELHNGAAWSTDGTELFLAHSDQGTVFRHGYDLAQGQLVPGQPFVRLPAGSGLPDGAAVDEDGCYWCAIHGGGALHRYDPAGRLVDTVPLPVSQPTMCAFMGEALDQMVVTSAAHQLTDRQRRLEPHAGGLFRLRPGVRGIPRPCVAR